jgi:hypothetical protein
MKINCVHGSHESVFKKTTTDIILHAVRSVLFGIARCQQIFTGRKKTKERKVTTLPRLCTTPTRTSAANNVVDKMHFRSVPRIPAAVKTGASVGFAYDARLTY